MFPLRYSTGVVHVRWLALFAGCVILCIAAARPVVAQNDQPGKSDPEQNAAPLDDKTAPNATVKLRIEVSNNVGKPIPSASVYVRFNQAGGFLHHDHLAELDLKTNQDGTVKVPAIPQGKIMIQVIATGWHTYGKWYDINKSEDVIQIKLDPPPHWY